MGSNNTDDHVSDGVSEDSNLEAMVSASSNKRSPTNEISIEFLCRSKERQQQMNSSCNELTN